MTIKTNIWSFAAALFWIIVAGFAGFGHTPPVLGINLWYVVLFGSLVTFVFGLYGFAGGTNVTFRVRSILTTVITTALAIFSAAVIVMAHIFSLLDIFSSKKGCTSQRVRQLCTVNEYATLTTGRLLNYGAAMRHKQSPGTGRLNIEYRH